jgi:hypothetical protein
MPDFKPQDRVQICNDYAVMHDLWKMADFIRLKDRLGTVVTVMPPLIEVLFDRRKPKGHDVLVALHNPDCLELVKRPRPRRA